MTFDVRPGRVTGFLGPNGSGKSTTMRMIVGLDEPSAGPALIGGRPYRDLAWPLRQVGTLLDGRAFHPGRSARCHLVALARANAIPRACVDEVLAQVGLSGVAGRRTGTFSLGMAQRLGVAAAMLGDPAVVILDEPMNGLDPEGIRWVRNLAGSLAEGGRTGLISSHLIAQMGQTADDVIMIGPGSAPGPRQRRRADRSPVPFPRGRVPGSDGPRHRVPLVGPFRPVRPQTRLREAAMTTTTATAPSSSSLYRLGDAMASEWTKFTSVRSVRWALAAFSVLTVAVGVAVSAATGAGYHSLSAADRAAFDPTNQSVTGLALGELATGVLGVLIRSGAHRPPRSTSDLIRRRRLGRAGRIWSMPRLWRSATVRDARCGA